MAFQKWTRGLGAGTLLLALAACSDGVPITPPTPDGPPAPPGAPLPTPFLVGNTGADLGTVIAVDAAGAVYVAGSFSGNVDFDPAPTTTVPRTALGESDLFLAKYSPTGSLIRVVAFGGTGSDRIEALSVDPAGAVWIGGSISSGFLCPGVSTTTPVLGSADAFVARLDASFNCQWINVVGAAGAESVEALAVDPAGNVAITGGISGVADFDLSTNTAFPLEPFGGGSDLFVASYGPTGAYRFASTLGNSGDERGLAIAADAAGALYVTTTFTGVIDADAGTGTSFVTTTGESDVLLTKVSSAGQFVWASRIGGLEPDEATRAMTLDGGDVVIGVTIRGSADLDPGAGTSAVQSLGGTDAVIARYSQATGALNGTPQQIGGLANVSLRSVAAVTGGQLAISGRYAGTIDVDPTGGVRALVSSQAGAATEAFYAVLASGGAPVWALSIGGTPAGAEALSIGGGLAPAPDGNFWALATVYGLVDLDPSPESVVALAPLGQGDAAVARYSATGTLLR